MQPSRVALDHQSDEDEEVEPIEIASNRSGGAAFGGWRFSREGSAARLRGSFAPSHGSTDSSAALPVCDLYHPMYCEDVLSIVFKKLDVVRTIQVRLVCKSWNSLLKRMCLDPIERVSKSDKTDRKQAYKTILLIRAFYEERALYGGQALLPASTRKESNSGIASTTELLLEMSARRELHNTNESAFLTSVQLADRFVSYKNASTHRYPAICAAALRIGCFTEQERELPPEVLAALAHTRCSTSDVLHEERSMREAFSERKEPLVCGTAMDFLPHFLRAANLDGRLGDNDWTVARALVFYFVSVLLLDTRLRRLRPSLMSAAAVSCALMVLGRPAWSDALTFTSCYSAEEADLVVVAMLDATRRVSRLALDRKFEAVPSSSDSREPSLCAQVRAFLTEWRARRGKE